ncbi:inorganic phosphate transporter [Fodinisporobacter ferrooxydans]|uniref:Inorganic phosphate transporter n=1 Tax=Fodinisporobacter ferrooxydans TaxID=2901836 RepID=A0ABY4CJI7_9BACL|nr:inorganic phosphate transporter [Alicyclobacillaceae bacterium MYW30-H2]
MVYVLATLFILGFNFLSGFNDGGNLLAILANTRTIRPLVAILIIIASLCLGPLLFGTAVAKTIGTQIVNLPRAGILIVNIALLATLLTLGIAWYVKIPTSTTFALVGGLIGSSIIAAGTSSILWGGFIKVFASLFLSVSCGSIVGYGLYFFLIQLLRRFSYKTGIRILTIQYISAFLMTLGYSINDAEKSIGLLAIVWMLAKQEQHFHVFPWMILLSSAAFAAGLFSGGFRIAKTVGFHVFHSRPAHAVATQIATALVVFAASFFGGPVSTTQTVDSALVGVGYRAAKERIRFQVVRKMAIVWILTMPISFVIAASLTWICKLGGLV